MKRSIIILGLAALLLTWAAAGCGYKSKSGAGTPGYGATSVSIVDNAFQPGRITVAAGGTVTWKNNGIVSHTVSGIGWDSGQIRPGVEFSRTFTTGGTYDYHCSDHPSMTGAVVVSAGAQGTTPGAGQ